MTNRHESPFFTPRNRTQLLKALLPHWEGRKQDLYEMSLKHLKEEFKKMKQRKMEGLMRG